MRERYLGCDVLGKSMKIVLVVVLGFGLPSKKTEDENNDEYEYDDFHLGCHPALWRLL
jgi:hypothetical protein